MLDINIPILIPEDPDPDPEDPGTIEKKVNLNEDGEVFAGLLDIYENNPPGQGILWFSYELQVRLYVA